MPMKSKRVIEDEVSQAVSRFEKEYMGRGPLDARAYLVDDMVLVRLKDVLTPAERKLAADPDPHRGRDLIKQVRQQLIESGAAILCAAIQEIVGVPVRSLHTDISTRTGERVIVFTLEARPTLAFG